MYLDISLFILKVKLQGKRDVIKSENIECEICVNGSIGTKMISIPQGLE